MDRREGADMLTVKNNIRKYRKAMGYDQELAASTIDISREEWNRIENGKVTPSLLTALKMASQLDTTVEELFEISLAG